MNILMVTLGFHPAVAWGGPVQIVRQNARELVRRGHRVSVYCTNLLNKREHIRPGTFGEEVDGIRVAYFHTWRLPWWPGTLGPVWMPDLPVYLKSEIDGFDIVHLNGYRNPFLLPVVSAARRACVPIVSQPHGTLPVIVNSLWAKRIYDRVLGGLELRNVAVLIAGQESERQQALALGVPPERIEIIANGLGLPEQGRPMYPLGESPEPGSFRRQLKLPAGKPLILFLGRINKKKGADMLVEAFHRLDGLDAHLAIAGPDDGQLAEVRRLIARYNLGDRVSLPGLLSGSEVMAAYRDADLFVLPCRMDTFPMSVVEACQAETPMVITDGCEIAHLVRDRVADVVPFDASAFSEAMKRLLIDRERHSRYRQNCQAVMRDTFSLEMVVDRLEAVYERVGTNRTGVRRKGYLVREPSAPPSGNGCLPRGEEN